jgi:hypothetical protein
MLKQGLNELNQDKNIYPFFIGFLNKNILSLLDKQIVLLNVKKK